MTRIRTLCTSFALIGALVLVGAALPTRTAAPSPGALLLIATPDAAPTFGFREASYVPSAPMPELRAVLLQSETPAPGLLQQIIEAIVALLTSAIAVYVAHQAFKLNGTIEGLPGVVHQLITVAEAFIAMKLTALLGVTFPSDLLAGFANSAAAQTGLTAFFAWIIHRVFKPKTA